MADKWNQYAERRRDLKYYAAVREEILRHSPGESILDVGCGGTDLVMTGQFATRHAVNLDPIDGYPAKLLVGRWPDIELPRERYDVALCCQVLEHLTDHDLPKFCERLKNISSVLIVSVPYRWERGRCRYHRQDPVDEAKLAGWLGEPKRSKIIDDAGVRRLVAVYAC